MRAHSAPSARVARAGHQLALGLAACLVASPTHRAEWLLLALDLDARPQRVAPLRWTLTLPAHTSPIAEGRTREECLHASLAPLVALARTTLAALTRSASPDCAKAHAIAAVLDAEGAR